MVSAILLHYVIDDPLPTHGTFGDPGSNPGSNPGADNFFFACFECFSCLVLFSYYINCFSTWYVWLLLVTYLHTK